MMDAPTLFGLFAVTAMLVACALGSIYGFWQGAWPFGLLEGDPGRRTLRRWNIRRRVQ